VYVPFGEFGFAAFAERLFPVFDGSFEPSHPLVHPTERSIIFFFFQTRFLCPGFFSTPANPRAVFRGTQTDQVCLPRKQERLVFAR